MVTNSSWVDMRFGNIDLFVVVVTMFSRFAGLLLKRKAGIDFGPTLRRHDHFFIPVRPSGNGPTNHSPEEIITLECFVRLI
jgi:hypothetical protein